MLACVIRRAAAAAAAAPAFARSRLTTAREGAEQYAHVAAQIAAAGGAPSVDHLRQLRAAASALSVGVTAVEESHEEMVAASPPAAMVVFWMADASPAVRTEAALLAAAFGVSRKVCEKIADAPFARESDFATVVSVSFLCLCCSVPPSRICVPFSQ